MPGCLDVVLDKYRFAFGIFILFLVDVIWVLSSELTEYIYHDANYNKPFFTTYFKTALFSLYLFGFAYKSSWRRHSCGERSGYQAAVLEAGEFTDSGDALNSGKLSVRQVVVLAFTFCLLWFLGNYSYQAALSDTEAGIVNVLSSSSSLFTLLFASCFPSGAGDKFTYSKLIAVIFSIVGVAMVSYSDLKIEHGFPAGVVWSLLGAVAYATYLVMFKRKVADETKLDITMFFGFVGLMNTVLLWPGFILLDYTGGETFQWPDRMQLVYITVNGLVGTVISEAMWLWGCFLTSSLVGTLAMSLTIPMSMFADGLIKGIEYPALFYIGSLPLLFAFVAVTILARYDNCDPLGDCLKRTCSRRKQHLIRPPLKHESEQRESLLDGEFVL